MEKNVLLTIEYDGTRFSGWQRQPGRRTVQGVLEALLTDIVYGDRGTDQSSEGITEGDTEKRAESGTVELNGTSRTDAGVHAAGQRASFTADLKIPAGNLKKVMNDRLTGRPENPGEDSDIRIVDVREVPVDFHARFDSKGKRYRYAIRNAGEMPVFDRNYRYLVTKELDIKAMEAAAGYIKGTHDFACFQATGGEPKETTVRTVTDLRIVTEPAPLACEEQGEESGRDIFIDISGDGFLYNMVRIIAGTLVEVGEGKIEPEALKDIIESKDRTKAGHTAPPQGLTLMEVFYDSV